MIDFSLSDEQRAVRDWVRTFVERELMPLENDVLRRERQGQPPGLNAEERTRLRELARKSDFWGVETPVEYGGMGLDPVTAAIIEIELGRTFLTFKFGGEADNILYHANEEQKERYLLPTIAGERRSCFAITEPGAGSDAKAIRTRAVRDGDTWVVNGEKTFITGGNEADFAMVFAVTDPDRGADGGVTCFLVDREAGWTSEPIDTMGERRPASLVFQDVRVPHENILGEEGRGFELAMKWIGKGRYLLPARALGGCERLLDMAIEYSRTRETFGAPIADRQAIQWMIADSQTEIEALRLLVLHAAWQVSVGRDSRHAQSIAKLFGGVKANEIVDRVMQIHGGMGYTRELPIERFYRDVRLLRIFEGTDEIQRRTIARDLLKGHVKVGATLG
ncbi:MULTISPECIES: acyl-CoA dehydrogenase family protein [Nocardiopsis]|uniref:Medium-chain specific acyl-CoA dehydrogenase, mitochondrial n=1 Tax=Nocardiopsis dassonvillei (strain ATCC 23218 / DSM 43111 / CIP 107115 / JCM 7437 / KCTC 9190 / NBRC 14626 / NCTC 10488 / NRRL B-5397 / IMRU 509) TaxID=446468 RepID=D7B1G8_NOCDD|nr:MULTISPECIES: acyl-CoA dehydrogenase family protein [Nocardiopsis]ADH66559.1 acyl-CoA dehydrogenase domain protein [Nocardiopsis dassonvillei subsp. dassonvillei DSM 43111]APC34876.1 acyl-CoA dehydrogenase [Nocardiopsis dassonvillei]NKY80974.1 acyl-CoA dehydrogenase [Nocardiopsis dassonvillei]VEI92581.1 (R)-benzylsuccinyl-CoA dehydrogenase [Nocardiopsis dassonvillei]